MEQGLSHSFIVNASDSDVSHACYHILQNEGSNLGVELGDQETDVSPCDFIQIILSMPLPLPKFVFGHTLKTYGDYSICHDQTGVVEVSELFQNEIDLQRLD